VEIARVAGNVRSATVPCEAGEYCVQCVFPDGTAQPIDPDRQCCQVTEEECACEIQEVNCDPGGNVIVITWTVSRDDCCQEFIIL
jgi:hypothetical protein